MTNFVLDIFLSTIRNIYNTKIEYSIDKPVDIDLHTLNSTGKTKKKEKQKKKAERMKTQQTSEDENIH